MSETNMDIHNQNEFLNKEVIGYWGEETCILKGLIDWTQNRGPAEYYGENILGSTEIPQVKQNHVSLPTNQIAESRVWGMTEKYGVQIQYDGKEALYDVINPTPYRAQALAAGARRVWERKIVNSLYGASLYGKDACALTMKNFPSSMIIEHGGTGMTEAKWLRAVLLLRKTTTRSSLSSPTILMTTSQEIDMLNETRATNGDFNNLTRNLPLVDAELPYWGGAYRYLVEDHAEREIDTTGTITNINFEDNRILPLVKEDDGQGGEINVRYCFAFNKNAVRATDVMSPSTRIIRTDETLGYFKGSYSLALEMACRSTRVDDFGVVLIKCVEDGLGGILGR